VGGEITGRGSPVFIGIWYKSAHVLMKDQAYKRLKFTCLLQIAELILLTYYSGGKQ
jgi:hypothetical protein